MPMPTIGEAPMAMPAASEETNSRGNSSDDRASPPMKPKNRASPPRVGVAMACILRPPGRSTAPIRSASARTTGVRQ